MRALYEINQDILDCVDLETGEILDVEKLDALQLEREGVLLVSPLYTAPCTPCLFLEACQALEDFGTWWETASAIPASDARVYRSTAQESLRRRRYEQFITYPLRLAARVRDPGPFLISFVPILMEAVWNQHADIAQRDLTAALSMPLLTRRPKEALQTWTRSIPGLLNARVGDAAL